MEDNELIERYLRGELSTEQVKLLHDRLETDADFKELFEIESVLVKGLQYSLEMQRIKELTSIQFAEPKATKVSLNNRNLWSFAGLALGVWIGSNLISGALSLNPSLIKWIGLMISILVPTALLLLKQREFSVSLLRAGALTGLLVFVLSSGIDAINQGISLKEEAARAILIPFTGEAAWWPTQSLIDSVAKEKTANRVLSAQQTRLNEMLNSVRDSCFQSRYEKVVPVVVPKASIVATGGYYEADVFGAVSYLLEDAVVTVNTKPVLIDLDARTGINVGKVKFKVGGANGVAGGEWEEGGLIKHSFDVSIKLDGKEYTDKIQYSVVAPVIRVTTGNAPTLYMNCGNTVNIEVPALGTAYDPSFRADGAEIIRGTKAGMVTIIPKQRKISVDVMNGGTLIGTQPFEVRNIPDPHYVAYVGGTPVDLRRGIRANEIGNLQIMAVPEANFKEEVPNDARYLIKRMEITLGRGTTGVQRMSATSENPDLRAWGGQSRPGDRIIIDIKEVVRKTFEGGEEQIDVARTDGILQIPIN